MSRKTSKPKKEKISKKEEASSKGAQKVSKSPSVIQAIPAGSRVHPADANKGTPAPLARFNPRTIMDDLAKLLERVEKLEKALESLNKAS